MNIEVFDRSGMLPDSCIHSINMTVERFRASRAVSSPLVFEITHNERLAGEVAYDLLFTVTADVMMNRLADETQNVEFEFPATPWQFFKEKYFPRFLLSKFPVRYNKKEKRLTIQRKAIFPFIPVERGLRDVRMDFFVREKVSISGENNER